MPGPPLPYPGRRTGTGAVHPDGRRRQKGFQIGGHFFGPLIEMGPQILEELVIGQLVMFQAPGGLGEVAHERRVATVIPRAKKLLSQSVFTSLTISFSRFLSSTWLRRAMLLRMANSLSSFFSSTLADTLNTFR